MRRSIADALRSALAESGRSHYSVHRQTYLRNEDGEGISQSILSRFANGKTVTLATAERLADVLGLRLELVAKPRGRRRRSAEGTA
jgi:hypothetical protein